MPVKVTCAIIELQGKVLLTQRGKTMSQPLLWEFPGGKIEPGETEEACLVREISEELQLNVTPYRRLTPVLHAYDSFSIELIPFICIYNHGIIQLQEHNTYHWASPADLLSYTWCPADLPIVQEYLAILSQQEGSEY